MTQNIYGLTRNTRPRRVQFILSGSKQFRKNGGPHLKGSRRSRKKVARPLLLRRPKVVFFGAQADFFFFFFRRRLVMVFDGQITFSTPPKTFSAPKSFFRPQFFFSAAFFFSAPKRKNLCFCFFRRCLVMVFGGQITFSIPPKYFSAAFFFF